MAWLVVENALHTVALALTVCVKNTALTTPVPVVVLTCYTMESLTAECYTGLLALQVEVTHAELPPLTLLALTAVQETATTARRQSPTPPQKLSLRHTAPVF